MDSDLFAQEYCCLLFISLSTAHTAAEAGCVMQLLKGFWKFDCDYPYYKNDHYKNAPNDRDTGNCPFSVLLQKVITKWICMRAYKSYAFNQYLIEHSIYLELNDFYKNNC